MSIKLTCKCGASIVADEAHATLYARCPACGALCPVTKAETPTATDQAPRPAKTTAPEDPGICAACGKQLSPNEGVYCLRCHTPHHIECWQKKNGCSVPTCPNGPQSRRHIKRTSDRTEATRPCPACGERIPTHAQRCRHCGEFTNKALRSANHHRHEAALPTQTSYAAGTSLLLGFAAPFVILLTRSSLLEFVPSILLPLGAVGTGLWAIRDIKKTEGRKRGYFAAGAGTSVGALSILFWIFTLLERFV